MSENVIIPPENEAFNDFDREFGAFLNRYAQNSSVELAATGMLLSRELRNGSPRLDLNDYAGRTIMFPDGKTVTLPETQAWLEGLLAPEMGGVAVSETEDDGKSLLLVFRNRILMMRRYAMLEKELAMQLERRKSYRDAILNDFAGGGDWVQDLAVFMALNSRLTILTGGPGTGKTTVCGRIIRELLQRDPELKILFAAPTGKAQQRLASQISDSAEALDSGSAAYTAMKAIAGTTLHSFLYNSSWREQLAGCDLMIIDECSMIPLELFSQILSMLPETCALLLGGDRRQLAPIESGTVFADLCRKGQPNCLPTEISGVFNSIFSGNSVPIEQGGQADFSGFIVELQTNYRSATAPTICRLAELLRDDDAEIKSVVSEIVNASGDDYRFLTLDNKTFQSELKKKCQILAPLPELCSSGKMEDIEKALKLSEEFHFLCAVNRGPRGCEKINETVLKELDIVPNRKYLWKPGTILMVTVNNYQAGLRNGDVGIVTREADESGEKHDFCRFHSCPEKRYPLGMLPRHECGFAITIHKAQGSGYKEAVVILPGCNSEVLQRKLIYTGITRAAKYLELWGTPGELLFALKNQERSSVNLF